MKCGKCGKEFKNGAYVMFNSDCDDCNEKERYYTPDQLYPMKKLEKTYTFCPKEPISSVTFIGFKRHIYNDIQKEIKEKNFSMAVVFYEYEKTDKLKELTDNRKVDLKISYFYTNNKFDISPNFEDRKKEMVIVTAEE